MNTYDQQYYFIEKPENSDSLPSLSPDENTEDRSFRYEKQPMGSPPLVFYNGAKEYNKKRGVKSVSVPPEILFSGSNLVVPSRLREALLALDIPHLHLHPTIYIHDDGKWYEDYWCLIFTEHFDCWDRTHSTYEVKPLELGGFKLHSVYTYSLNEQLLDKTPLEQRLLFKMGGTQDGYIVCHQKLAPLFSGPTKGTQLTKIPDY